MITKVNIENVKGSDILHNFSGKDIVIGPMGEGKSTILNTVYFALKGFFPHEDERDKSVAFKSSSKNEMGAGLHLTDLYFKRSIKKNRKLETDGTYKESFRHSIELEDGGTLKEKEKIIQDYLGDYNFALDFNKFLDLSDKDKRKFVFDMIEFDDSKYTKLFIKSLLDQKLLKDLENEDYVFILKDALIKTLEKYDEEKELFENLNKMNTFLTETIKTWNANKKTSKAGQDKLTELKNNIAETDRNYIKNKKDLKEQQESLTKNKENYAADKEKIEFNEKRENDIKNKENEIEELKKYDFNTKNKKLKEIEDKIKENNLKIIFPDTKEFEELKTESKKLNETLEELKFEGRLMVSNIKTKENILKSLKEFDKKCPLDNNISCEQDFSEYTLNLSGEILKMINEKDEKLTEYKRKKLILNNIDEKIKKNEEKFAKMEKENKNFKDENQKLEIEKIELELEIKNQEKDITKEQNNLVNLKMIPLKIISEKSTILKKLIDSTKNTIKELEDKIEEQNKSRITMSNLKETMIDVETAELTHLAYKNINNTLSKEVINKIFKESLTEIEKDISKNLELLGIEHPFFFNVESKKGKETFEFGWKKGKKEIEYLTLSSGEKLLLITALMITFIDKINPPLKLLLIDNINHLDHKNIDKLLQGLSEIDSFDNILLAGIVNKNEVDFHDFNVIDLEEINAV